MNHKRINLLLVKMNLHMIMVGSRVNSRPHSRSGMDNENPNVLLSKNDGNVDIVNMLPIALQMLASTLLENPSNSSKNGNQDYLIQGYGSYSHYSCSKLQFNVS